MVILFPFLSSLTKTSIWTLLPVTCMYLAYCFLFGNLSPNSMIKYSMFNSEFCYTSWFVALSLWSISAAYLASMMNNNSSLSLKSKNFYFLITMLLLFFSSKSFLILYLSFEASLIPILFMVLGWGYQPERIFAGLSMLFYTMVASLPMFAALMLNSVQSLSFQMISKPFSGEVMINLISNWWVWGLVLGFMVKLPIYMGHLWLPRAHVEAPVEGSMVLAAIMLKLGAFGGMRVLPNVLLNSNLIYVLIFFSLMGGALVSIICTRQTDLKTLVAYSSVAHMSLAFASSLSGKISGSWAASAAFLSHGFISSGLFLGAYYLYSRTNSRNLLMTQSSLTYFPLFSLFWFILALGNMGAPPSPNLLAEIFMIICVMAYSFYSSLPLIFLTGLATLFTLNLFMMSHHLQKLTTFKKGFFLSSYECLNLTIHSWPALAGGLAVFFMM